MTDNMDHTREYWRARFERQKTVRLATLRECAEELYGQALQIHQRKDMIYSVAMPGLFARNFPTIRDAGLAITSPETYERLTQASVPATAVSRHPIVPFLRSLFGLG